MKYEDTKIFEQVIEDNESKIDSQVDSNNRYNAGGSQYNRAKINRDIRVKDMQERKNGWIPEVKSMQYDLKSESV